MKFAAFFVCLTGTALSACAYLPTAGPTAGEVVEQGIQDNQIRYDVIEVNANVVSVLLAQPAESFDRRFGRYGKPPAPKIGVGDTVSVTIWEAADGGLFGTSATIGVSPGARSATIPDQVVSADGGITVPFAGRVPVAGRSIVDVQHEIERRLAEKAIEPQVIVTVSRSVRSGCLRAGFEQVGSEVFRRRWAMPGCQRPPDIPKAQPR